MSQELFHSFHDPKRRPQVLEVMQKNLSPAGFSLAEKVLSSATEEQWKEFCTHHEVPAVKLSAKEMEVLKGGFWKEVKMLIDAYNAIKDMFGGPQV